MKFRKKNSERSSQIDASKWEIDVKYKEVIDLRVAQFILDQAEKSFDYISAASDKITNRAFSILLIMLPITSTVFGFLINEITKKHHQVSINAIFFLVISIICIIVLLYLVKLVFPRKFMEKGREPKAIATRDMLINKLTDDNKLLSFTLNEVKNYQNKISYNRSQNNQRIRQLENILKAISLTFGISIFFYLSIVLLQVFQ